MASNLRVELFGGFRLFIDGTPVAGITSQGLQSFLAYLVLHRDTPQPRQQLAFLLYPDSSDTQAQKNLRTLLTRLRRAWPGADQCLLSDGGTLQWNPERPYTFDVAEFETAIAEGAARHTERVAARAALEKAVDLYRGELLPSCYQDWILAERERLRLLYLHALEQFIELLQARREYGLALVHAQHLLQLDPLQETTYQLLMRLHAAHGNRLSVARTFETCENVLEQELGVEPGAETRELARTLQQAAPNIVLSAIPLHASGNLPVPLTSFIGRARELTETRRLLEGTRLLTLTGAGGSGKSRLALRVAHDLREEYADGVWWVELAPLTDPALIPQAVAQSLGIAEQGGRRPVDTVLDALKSRQILLILDNCEHLGQACAEFAAVLLQAGAGLSMLATSREALGLLGETVYVVPPLSIPGGGDAFRWEAIAQSDAGRLFVERAQAVSPTFTLTQQNARGVREICRRLDGIPLALELAAARVKSLSVEQIAARLDDRFNLLKSGNRGALPRHQTLRAMVDWSYALLDATERALLRALSVFAGGWTLEAAEAVFAGPATLDLLSRLIDKSLVVVETERGGESARYRLLETIRQYGLEKLIEAGEEETAYARHLDFFTRMAVESERELRGPSQVEWLNRLEVERDNLRAALASSIESKRTQAVLRLAGNLGRFWYVRSEFVEGRRWLDRALAMDDAAQYPADRMQALFFQGILAWLQKGGAEARPYLEECLALARVLNDKEMEAHGLDFLGLVAAWEQDLKQARTNLQESLALFGECRDQWGYGQALWHLGWVEQDGGNPSGGLELLQQASRIYEELGDGHRLSVILRSIAFASHAEGEYERALPILKQALSLARQAGSKYEIANALSALAENTSIAPERRVTLLTASVRLQEMIGALKADDEESRQKALDPLERQLEQRALEAAVARGNAMTVEEAIDLALDS